MTRYWKITNEEECHHGLRYQDGRVDDTVPFCDDLGESCVPGGIYFTDTEHVLDYLAYGPWIREVTVPPDAQAVEDPSGGKWRASAVVLGPRRRWADADVLQELLDGGAKVSAFCLIAAVLSEQIESVELLLSLGADADEPGGLALRSAVCNGNVAMVTLLLARGANVNALAGDPLRIAVLKKNVGLVRLLLDHGANPNLGDYWSKPLILAKDFTTKDYMAASVRSQEDRAAVAEISDLLKERGAK